MDINLIGNQIKLINTNGSDIDQIIGFETLNKQYVHSYSKDKHLVLLDDNDCLHLSIRNNKSENLIGHLILFGLENRDKVLEFRRIVIVEKGQGFGHEAINLVKKLCFEKLCFHRLWLDVYDDNKRAIQLYESEGFIKEGVLRESIKAVNGYRSLRIYSMLENEYKV